MLKRNNALIAARAIPIPANIGCNSNSIPADKNLFVNDLVAQGIPLPHLPANPPFEIHPYKTAFPLRNYEKYIIGTFPPISYILDEPAILAAGIIQMSQPLGVGGNIITKPEIPFFHGNQGSMWDYLLTPIELEALLAFNPLNRGGARDYLIDRLIELKINYADIIYSAQRNTNKNGRYTASDSNLNNICINKDLICHVLKNPVVKYLLFNSAKIFGGAPGLGFNGALVNISSVKSFDLFIRGCQEIGLRIEIQIPAGNPFAFPWTNIIALLPAQRTNKLVFEMRISNPENNRSVICDELEPGHSKVFTVVTGPSPSPIVALGLIGNVICDTWLAINPGSGPPDFVRFVYQSFRNSMIAPLFQLNQ